MTEPLSSMSIPKVGPALGAKNTSVLQLLQETVLQELHSSTGNVKEEHALGGIDCVREVITFSDTKEL